MSRAIPRHDAFTSARLKSGDLAIYVGTRRVGTIVKTASGFAYVPAGVTETTGAEYPNEDAVLRSLMENEPK